MKIKAIFGMTTLALGLSVQIFADTTSTLNTEASRMNTLAANHGETNVTGKISGTFNSFLGSDSTAVVTGLRNGTPITLTTTTPATTPGGAPTVTTTVIAPPTGQMGHGNVFISLALAKQQLGQLGISQPNPQQLQAALTGGTITTGTGETATTSQLQGVLTMLLCRFLTIKDRPLIRLTSTIEVRRPGRKIIPCVYQSKPVAKVGTAEPSIRNPLYLSSPPLVTEGRY